MASNELENYIKQLTNFESNECKTKLQNYYTFNASTIQYFKGIDKQFNIVLNTAIINGEMADNIVKITDNQISILNNLKRAISSSKEHQFTNILKKEINECIIYITSTMQLSEVQTLSKTFNELNQRNINELLAEKEERLKNEKLRLLEIERIKQEEIRKQKDIEEKKRIEDFQKKQEQQRIESENLKKLKAREAAEKRKEKLRLAEIARIKKAELERLALEKLKKEQEQKRIESENLKRIKDLEDAKKRNEEIRLAEISRIKKAELDKMAFENLKREQEERQLKAVQELNINREREILEATKRIDDYFSLVIQKLNNFQNPYSNFADFEFRGLNLNIKLAEPLQKLEAKRIKNSLHIKGSLFELKTISKLIKEATPANFYSNYFIDELFLEITLPELICQIDGLENTIFPVNYLNSNYDLNYSAFIPYKIVSRLYSLKQKFIWEGPFGGNVNRIYEASFTSMHHKDIDWHISGDNIRPYYDLYIDTILQLGIRKIVLTVCVGKTNWRKYLSGWEISTPIFGPSLGLKSKYSKEYANSWYSENLAIGNNCIYQKEWNKSIVNNDNNYEKRSDIITRIK